MIGALARKFFGSANDRRVKGYQSRVNAINAIEPELAALSDEALKARTAEFRQQLANGKTLDDILVPAFATVREAAKRTLGQRHFDVQLMGGMVLHEGNIAEMKTGEGKTLVATLAVYLNALTGDGVHVVTVNDYLARRDSEWMGQIYSFLGMTHGRDRPRPGRYRTQGSLLRDITYGTNNEFGFDYLRDNMKYRLENMVQRAHFYAIVDEVNSILIDEARTPLIISGPPTTVRISTTPSTRSCPGSTRPITTWTRRAHRVADRSRHGKDRDAAPRRGLLKGDSLYDTENVSVVHHVNQALKAHPLFHTDKDYIVRDDEVIIIDEFTGRMMEGRRYSEGLHQALEAKEGVQVLPENVTLASITFQNYFRLYGKLAGMTGTAMTEADEFMRHLQAGCAGNPDQCAGRAPRRGRRSLSHRRTRNTTRSCRDRMPRQGRSRCWSAPPRSRSPKCWPCISRSRHNRSMHQVRHGEALRRGARRQAGQNFAVLNARYHEQEAFIVAEAGVPGAVTIATNMAGRGTDIQLGGMPRCGSSRNRRHHRRGREGRPDRRSSDIERFREIVLKAETSPKSPAKSSRRPWRPAVST